MRFQFILLSISILLILSIVSNAQDSSDNSGRKLPTQFNRSDESQNNNNSGDSKLPTQFNHQDEKPGSRTPRDPIERYSGSGTYYYTFLSDTYVDGSIEESRMDGSKYYYYYWSCYSVSRSEADNTAGTVSSSKGYSSYNFTKFVKDN